MAGVVYLPVGKYAHGWRLSGLRPDTPPATAHKSGMPPQAFAVRIGPQAR